MIDLAQSALRRKLKKAVAEVCFYDRRVGGESVERDARNRAMPPAAECRHLAVIELGIE